MRIIIAGCRHFNNYEKFKKCIAIVLQMEWNISSLNGLVILSGGAKGTDTMGEQLAKEYNLPLEIYPANWALGLSGGPVRNTEMANNADCLIAFPSQDSKGTRDMIRKAIAKGLKVKVIEI